MTYIQNGIVETADFNNFLAAINEVLTDYHPGSTGEEVAGFGYGQPVNTRPVFVGDLITAGPINNEEEWALLFNDVNDILIHQSDTTPFDQTFLDTEITQDLLIKAYPVLVTSVDDLVANKFDVGTQVDVVSNALTDQRTATWDGIIKHEFVVTWNSWNEMRYFFNSGGKILTTPTFTPDGAIIPGSIDEVWDDLLNNLGDIVFNYTETSANGPGPNIGTGTLLGFYDLSDEDIQVWFTQGGLAYGSDSAALLARLNDVPGSANEIIFTLALNSSIDGVPVTGTFDSNIGHIVAAAGGTLTIAPPTYATTVSLSDGGEFQPFDATITADSINKTCVIFGSCPNDFTVTANPTGAIGNVSYLWEFDSNLLNDFIILSGQGTDTIILRSADTDTPVTSVATIKCTLVDDGRTDGTIIRSIILNSSSDYSTLAVFITGITLNNVPIYNGVGTGATGTVTCTGTTQCSNVANLTATIAGPEADTAVVTWELLDNAGGKFTQLGATSGLVTSTTAISNTSVVGLVRITATAGGDTSYVDISLDSIHNISGSSLAVNVSFPGGTTPSCQADGSGDCVVTFVARATPTGGTAPYTNYVWNLSFLTFGGSTEYSIQSGQGTNQITIISTANQNLPTIDAEVTVTDSVASNAFGSATARPFREVDDLNVVIDTRPVPTCSYNRDAAGNPTFCVKSAPETATVTGGDGNFTYRWTITGGPPDTGNAYFGSPGVVTSTSIAPVITTTNDGIDPIPNDKENRVGYFLFLDLLDTNQDVIASATTVLYWHLHKDITPNISIGTISITNGSCSIDSGTTCPATALASFTYNGAPDGFLWYFDSNPNNVFSFSGGTQSPFGYVTTGPNVSIISTEGAGTYTGKIYALVAKAGQNNKISGIKQFTNTHIVNNIVSFQTGFSVSSDTVIERHSPTPPAHAELIFFRNGTWRRQAQLFPASSPLFTVLSSGTWITNGNGTIGDGYEIRYSVNSPGDTPGGNISTAWQSLASFKKLNLSQAEVHNKTRTKQASLTVYIRQIGNASNSDSAFLGLSVRFEG